MMDTDYQEIHTVAVATRNSLKQVWPCWRWLNHCPEAPDGRISYQTCIPSSFTLQLVLLSVLPSWNWHVRGGRPTSRTPKGGLWYPNGEGGPHFWVEGRRRVRRIVTVDITADQFGGPEIVVSPGGSTDHVANTSRQLLDSCRKNEAVTVKYWTESVFAALHSRN